MHLAYAVTINPYLTKEIVKYLFNHDDKLDIFIDTFVNSKHYAETADNLFLDNTLDFITRFISFVKLLNSGPTRSVRMSFTGSSPHFYRKIDDCDLYPIMILHQQLVQSIMIHQDADNVFHSDIMSSDFEANKFWHISPDDHHINEVSRTDFATVDTLNDIISPRSQSNSSYSKIAITLLDSKIGSLADLMNAAESLHVRNMIRNLTPEFMMIPDNYFHKVENKKVQKWAKEP